MIWPLLRALEARGREVTVVAPASKAALAAAELGVIQQNAEVPRFIKLWQGAAGVKPSDREEGVSEVYSFLTDERTEPGRTWMAGARAMFPGASVAAVGAPGSGDRRAVWMDTGAAEALAELRENPRGPVVLHVGAGSASKRWPMERWYALRAAIREGVCDGTADVRAIAGEVEEEQFNTGERRVFAAMDGRFLEKLGELAAVIKGARLFIGADSGPTHLAAQLGVPTLALFGPTDPAVWAPTGPCVRVLVAEPHAGRGMDGTERVARPAVARAMSELGLRAATEAALAILGGRG
jgi:hypothetical protein